MSEIAGLRFTHKSIRLMGGEHSGNWGHAGRPGSVGGSAPGGGFVALGMSAKDGKPLTDKQQAIWGKVVSRVNEGELPHLKELVKSPKIKPIKSDASKVRVINAEPGERKRIRGYLENLPQDHIDQIAQIAVVGRLGFGGDCNDSGDIRISRSERGENAWDPKTRTYYQRIGGGSSKEAIIHETGHAVHFRLRKYGGKVGVAVSQGFDQKVRRAAGIHNKLSKGNHISDYATKNHFEFFAESYYAYTHKSKATKLERISKLMEPRLGYSYYDLMKGLFGGREYKK